MDTKNHKKEYIISIINHSTQNYYYDAGTTVTNFEPLENIISLTDEELCLLKKSNKVHILETANKESVREILEEELKKQKDIEEENKEYFEKQEARKRKTAATKAANKAAKEKALLEELKKKYEE
jgi:hypothetical protein